ncbi:MAG: class II fructose-bisphosphate aldolase [Sporomusaceae bacterium]|nr:class II fructose-bisphosphate aldolase [Sporomusaceae bacterium]
MALVTLADILKDARKRNYAVGGFNVFNFETLGAVVEVAEELKTPLVLGIAERLFKFADVDTLAAAMLKAAQKSSVPIALHLDHGHTYEGLMKAIRWGFTSVMYDGSALPLEENIKRTKDITRIAHSLGLSVEGELGYIGCLEGIAPSASAVSKPELAAEYVQKTKIDALAVGIGHNHGNGKTPALNYTKLEELHKAVHVPLVMHGGSRMQREEYRRVIDAGIAKINIATDMSMAAAETLKSELAKNPASNYISLMTVVKKGVKDSVRKYMLSFDCISKAL